MNSKAFSLSARTLWLALVAYAAWQGAWATVAFHAVLFLGSAFLLRRDEYLTLDTLVALTFASSIFVTLVLSWETDGLLGFDKLYHLLGGMCLGWFASIRYRSLDGWRYPAVVVGTAFVLGAAWELLELLFALLPPPLYLPFNPLGWLDSAGDLVADTLGAATVAWIRRKG